MLTISKTIKDNEQGFFLTFIYLFISVGIQNEINTE